MAHSLSLSCCCCASSRIAVVVDTAEIKITQRISWQVLRLPCTVAMTVGTSIVVGSVRVEVVAPACLLPLA